MRRDSSSIERRGTDAEATTEDHDAFIAHVIAISPEGTELVYDLPADASSGERASEWHFPARVFRPVQGPLRLLNRAELSARVDPWLTAGELTRAACGHLIFTWTAIRIDCEPDTVLRVIDAIDPTPFELRDGAFYTVKGALSAARLRRSEEAGGTRYTANLLVDPEIVRRAEADTDVAVGELTGKPVTLIDAMAVRAAERITGTIQVTFIPDAAGRLGQRTCVTRLEIVSPDGKRLERISTEVLTREHNPALTRMSPTAPPSPQPQPLPGSPPR